MPYHRVIAIGDQRLPVLSLRGLALTKRGIRPKDIADAQAIAEALRRKDDQR